MLKPNPLSPFMSSIIWGSLLHIASPVRGSRDLDFNLESAASMGGEEAADVPIAKDPSDFALTSLSDVGVSDVRLPPKGPDIRPRPMKSGTVLRSYSMWYG